MLIKTYTVGPLKEHPYLIIDEKSKQAALIDPGGGSDQIIDDLAKFEANLKFIINTHGHPDHITENGLVADMTKAPILIHKNDAPAFKFDFSNFERKYNMVILPGEAGKLLKGGEELEIGKNQLTVMHTPGHTPGSICLYLKNEKALFTGDTLFKETIGRTDLPFSNPKMMQQSLKKLFDLPDGTNVYPGHGSSTLIGNEKQFDQYYHEQLSR